jgi:Ca2+-binding RTX toxin-like protein
MTTGEAPPTSERLIVDSTTSTMQGTFSGVTSPVVAVNGVVRLVRQCIPLSEEDECGGGIATIMDRVNLGTSDFTFGGQSISGTHITNIGTFNGQPAEGGFAIPRGFAVVNSRGLFDNVSKGASLVNPQDLVGGFDDDTGVLTVATTLSDPILGGSVTVNIRGVAQPTGTDTDHDGVPDLNDNCPRVPNPTQIPITAPGLTAPPAVTITGCSNTAALGKPTLTDICGAPPVTVTNNAPPVFPLGQTTVTWTASDSAGNVRTATQLVTVVMGDDPSCCPPGSHIIMGTPNNDTLVGTDGPDCILGLGGQDHISGGGGDDVISGGDGDDVIDGGAGNDRIFGGAGQDQITGGIGNDFIDGGDGDDTCHGNDGDDVIHGGNGQDHLFGDAGNDQLFGDDGDDTLDGGAGNDALNGGGLHDVCIGGTGTNTFTMCQTIK